MSLQYRYTQRGMRAHTHIVLCIYNSLTRKKNIYKGDLQCDIIKELVGLRKDKHFCWANFENATKHIRTRKTIGHDIQNLKFKATSIPNNISSTYK